MTSREDAVDVLLDAELCTAVIDGMEPLLFDGYYDSGIGHEVFMRVRLRMIDRMYDGVGGRVRDSLNSIFWDELWR